MMDTMSDVVLWNTMGFQKAMEEGLEFVELPKNDNCIADNETLQELLYSALKQTKNVWWQSTMTIKWQTVSKNW
jgi:hypothetical protein